MQTRPANISSTPSKPNSTRAALRKATLLPFVFVMYAYATGGPFGLEDMVTTSGPGLTLLYHLILPFFWCIPVSLVAAELTTAIPVEGGFYRWVRAGFGDFWDFSRAGGTGARRSFSPPRTPCYSRTTSQIIFRSTSRFPAGCITPLPSR